MKNPFTKIILGAALLSAASLALFAFASVAQAGDKQCVPIGGTALGQFFNEGKDVVGAMSGTWAATRGTVVTQKKTATGLLLGMEHAFTTGEGGVVRTHDNVVLTTIPGKKDDYGLDIAYTVVESFGHLKGYTGTFNSYGRINTASGEAVVRYSGQLCK